MPFDSEGMFSRLHNWEDDRINDIDIVTDHMDEEDDNFADGLSQCFLKNGNSKMEGNFNAGNFKLMNVADGTLPADAVNRGQLDKSTSDSTAAVKEIMNMLVKIGDIKASVIAENHGGWLLCDGQERTTDCFGAGCFVTDRKFRAMIMPICLRSSVPISARATASPRSTYRITVVVFCAVSAATRRLMFIRRRRKACPILPEHIRRRAMFGPIRR